MRTMCTVGAMRRRLDFGGRDEETETDTAERSEDNTKEDPLESDQRRRPEGEKCSGICRRASLRGGRHPESAFPIIRHPQERISEQVAPARNQRLIVAAFGGHDSGEQFPTQNQAEQDRDAA